MNEIFFLVFAFLTIFLSVKISCYADSLSKCGVINNALAGGIILAGVTALPEFVTCFSSIFLGNMSLAMGDVLGSNLFNFFMICVFDIIFVKKMIFCNSSLSHAITLVLLIINYLFLFCFCTFLSFDLGFVGIPSVVIFVTYLFYVMFLAKKDSFVCINDYGVNTKYLVLKLVIASVCMVLSSVILTVIVNNLSFVYQSFSSSFLGAIFLGVTTSLPEVVTFYTLISVNNYDLAFADIFGSNMFNLLVLGFGDLFGKGVIYSFCDKGSVFIILFGFIFSFLCLFSSRRNCYSFISYCLVSLVVVLLYIGFWLFNFLY